MGNGWDWGVGSIMFHPELFLVGTGFSDIDINHEILRLIGSWGLPGIYQSDLRRNLLE